jgi:glycerate kinase
MTIQPGSLYQVSISDRGSGTVKAVRTTGDGMVCSIIVHGRFKNRVPNSQVRIDGDHLCFRPEGKGVTVKPLKLEP